MKLSRRSILHFFVAFMLVLSQQLAAVHSHAHEKYAIESVSVYGDVEDTAEEALGCFVCLFAQSCHSILVSGETHLSVSEAFKLFRADDLDESVFPRHVLAFLSRAPPIARYS